MQSLSSSWCSFKHSITYPTTSTSHEYLTSMSWGSHGFFLPAPWCFHRHSKRQIGILLGEEVERQEVAQGQHHSRSCGFEAVADAEAVQKSRGFHHQGHLRKTSSKYHIMTETMFEWTGRAHNLRWTPMSIFVCWSLLVHFKSEHASEAMSLLIPFPH